MTATLPPMIRFQPLVAGAPLPGGKVYFYQAGTLVPQAAYAADGTTPLANPLTLDANGTGDFRLGTGLTYKINVTDSIGTPVTGWPIDQITGLDGVLSSLGDTSSASLGDALIGVKQPFTGGTARTLHNKLSTDTVSVFDFLTTAQITDVQGNTRAVDVTAGVQAAITALGAAGGGTLLFPAGTYSVSALTVYTSNVRLLGYGACLYGSNKDSVILRVKGDDNHIEGLEITHGVTTVGEWSTKTGEAIYLEPNGSQVGCRRTSIENVYAHNISFICIAGDRCEDTKVLGCTVELTGGAGILMNATEGECLISGNRCYKTGDDGIMCVPVATVDFASLNGGKYNGGQVIGNTVDNCGDIYGQRGGTYLGQPDGAAGIKVAGARVIVDGNVVTNSGGQGIYVSVENGYATNGVIISNNHVYNILYYASSKGMRLISIPETGALLPNDIKIMGNLLDGAPLGAPVGARTGGVYGTTYGIYSGAATRLHIHGNTFRNVIQAMYIAGGVRVTISSNIIEDLKATAAVVVADDHCAIYNPSGVTTLVVSDNYFNSGNGSAYGTAIRHLSSDTVIVNNVFKDFTYDAVDLQTIPFIGWRNNLTNSNTQFANSTIPTADNAQKLGGAALRWSGIFATLPNYTTNALAIAGGLSAGAFYRTGADPDVVCVVH